MFLVLLIFTYQSEFEEILIKTKMSLLKESAFVLNPLPLKLKYKQLSLNSSNKIN
jgi:hypothetical protein